MKRSNKIILYLEGELSPEERISFENELNDSFELRKELEHYKNFISIVEETKNPHSNEDYFNSIVPRFRNKLGVKEKRNFIFRTSYAFPVLTIVFLVFIYFSNLPKEELVSAEANLERYYMRDYSADELVPTNLSSTDKTKYNSELNSLIDNELSISSDSARFYIADKVFDYESMLDNISNEDAQRVYNNLLNKKF